MATIHVTLRLKCKGALRMWMFAEPLVSDMATLAELSTKLILCVPVALAAATEQQVTSRILKPKWLEPSRAFETVWLTIWFLADTATF